jgi:hypothetical protein
MFVRVLAENQTREMLFNTNFIAKVEVMYGTQGPKVAWKTLPQFGAKDPNVIRFYKATLTTGDTFMLMANPDDPVVKVLEEICKNAIKCPEPKQDESGAA